MRGWASRARPIVGLVVVAVMAPACGSGTTAKESGFEISTVAQSTVDAGSARVAGTSTFTAENGERSVDTTVGELDFERMRSSFDTRGEAEGVPFVLHTRYLDGYVFLSPPEATSIEPDEGSRPVTDTRGKEWVREPHRLGSPLALLRMVDTARFLGDLERAGGTSELVGAEDIRGVPTRHHRVSLDAEAVPKQVEAMDSIGPTAETFEVWADAQHRLRRLESTFDMSFGRWTWELEVFDFGAPVTIEAPPSETVAIDDSSALTGDWNVVQSGTAGNDEWRLHRAPITDGVCFSPQTGPPSAPVGDPDQRGRSSELCVYDISEGPDGVVAYPDSELSAHASALPNGMALLYGKVTPDAKALLLRFSDGRVEGLTPSDETFAIALEADELVRTIVLEGADAKVSCDLDKHSSYTCDGTLGPSPWSDPPVSHGIPPPPAPPAP